MGWRIGSTAFSRSWSPIHLGLLLVILFLGCNVVRGCNVERINLNPAPSENVIKTLYYPDTYPPNLECQFYLIAPANKKVRLSFTDFQLESANTFGLCRFDIVFAYDGDSDGDPSFGSFCGSVRPPVLVSSGRDMYVRFISDGSVQAPGFRAVVQSVDMDYQEPLPTSAPDSCYRVLEESTGSFYSPGFPSTYDHNQDCIYVITIPDVTDTVKLQFTSFDLEPSQSCVYDYVEVRDGSSVAAPLLGRYCGGFNNNPPDTITSTSSSMFVLFHTDISAAFEGFYAQYAASSAGFAPSSWNNQPSTSTSVCDFSHALLTNDGGFIVSHDTYPEGTYGHGLDCVMQIVGARDYHRVFIDVLAMELPASPACGNSLNDHVEILDGQGGGRTSLGTLCGTDVGRYETSTQYATIRFHTNGATNDGYMGFRLLYSVYYEDAYGCEGGLFHCDNNHCIDSSLVCDNYDHCGDDSDETKGCSGDSSNSWVVVFGIITGCVLLILLGVIVACCCMKNPRPNRSGTSSNSNGTTVAVISNSITQPYTHQNSTFNPSPAQPSAPPALASSTAAKPPNWQDNPVDEGRYAVAPSPEPASLYNQRGLVNYSAPPASTPASLNPPLLPPVQFQSGASVPDTGGATGGLSGGGGDQAMGGDPVTRRAGGGTLPPLKGVGGKPSGKP